MDECISRHSAIETVRDVFKRSPTIAICAMDALRKLPSAQPERKTGQLKYESAYNWFRCNVCRKIYPSEFMQYFDSCQYQPGFNFCPNCGADMRGEQNEID